MTCGLGILALILLAGCDASVAECTTDSDCEGICESGSCEPAECGLAGGGAMCAAGELCMEGRCFPAPDGGVECTSDFECGEGICESGRCVPGECGFVGGGAMCAAGELCEEGRCYVPQDGGVECTSDGDCEGICESGRCVPGECGFVGGGAMCAAGELCEEGRCYVPAPDGG